MTDQTQEAEANYFAMCLLMPEELVNEYIAKAGIQAFDLVDDPHIEAMAKAFGVSLQLMVIRLCTLGYFNFVRYKRF